MQEPAALLHSQVLLWLWALGVGPFMLGVWDFQFEGAGMKVGNPVQKGLLLRVSGLGNDSTYLHPALGAL